MNIGLLLRHFGQSDLSFLTVAQCIDLVKEDKENTYYGFYEELYPFCLEPPMALMNICEIVDFRGVFITTNLNTTAKALNVVSDNKVVFYVNDLEWLRPRSGRANFFENIKIYQDPRLMTICPSEDYAKELKNYANVEVDHVIPAFNLRKIRDVIC